MTQALQCQAVDVAGIPACGLVVGKVGSVDDAVLEVDGDRIAVNLVDRLQVALYGVREDFRIHGILLAVLAAQDGEHRVLDTRDDGVLPDEVAQDGCLFADERA